LSLNVDIFIFIHQVAGTATDERYDIPDRLGNSNRFCGFVI